MAEQTIYEGDLSKPLAMAALGNPHLIITQVGTDVIGETTAGFCMDNLIELLKDLAAKNPRFRAALTDYIIELSQSV